MAGEEADYGATDRLEEQQAYENEKHEEEMNEYNLSKSKPAANNQDAVPAARISGDDSAVTELAARSRTAPFVRKQSFMGASPPHAGAWASSGSRKRPSNECNWHNVKEEKQEDAATYATSKDRAADAAVFFRAADAGRVWEVDCEEGWTPLPDDIQEELDNIRGTDKPTTIFRRNRKHSYVLDTTNMTSQNRKTKIFRTLQCRGLGMQTTQSSDTADNDHAPRAQKRSRDIGPDDARGPVASNDIDRVWEVQGDAAEGWVALPDKVQLQLDEAWIAYGIVTYKKNPRHVYVLDAKAMTSQNKRTTTLRKLRWGKTSKKQDSSNATSS